MENNYIETSIQKGTFEQTADFAHLIRRAK